MKNYIQIIVGLSALLHCSDWVKTFKGWRSFLKPVYFLRLYNYLFGQKKILCLDEMRKIKTIYRLMKPPSFIALFYFEFVVISLFRRKNQPKKYIIRYCGDFDAPPPTIFFAAVSVEAQSMPIDIELNFFHEKTF